ncbi:MAG: DUF1800 domain-containing protein [Chitinophagaceae bacterium]
MDRKAFLNTLLAPPLKKKPAPSPEQKIKITDEDTPVFLRSGVTPYVGSWTDMEVMHLLKRLQFGAPREEVEYFKTLTYTQAVDLLLNTVNANPGLPIKVYSLPVTTPRTDGDWSVPEGKTWVNIQSADGSANGGRIATCKGWWLDLMINQPRSIEEKMMLFWANHFSVEFDSITYGTYAYRHLNTIRTHALGNFKSLTKAISLEASMLSYLNGQYNTKTAPDENYGRELMELFTLGKGPGSQYTETDVQTAAKVLTGYRITNATSTYFFDSTKHDTTNKQFSTFFNSTIITGVSGAGGAGELDSMLDMIFQQNEVSKYLCRCLYRFFVYGNISADVEANVITPMATLFKSGNYEVKPVLDLLFKSEHFFDVLTQGAMIKSPLDYIVGQIREFKVRFPPASNAIVYYKMLGFLISNASIQDQNLGDPPNVSGWPAYYQDPIFDKSWLNTDTYTKRLNHNLTMLAGYTNTNQKIQLDWITLARRMSNPSDPNMLVQDFVKYLLRTQLTQTTRDNIKTTTLLTGQTTDGYWTTAWNNYLANPGNPTTLNDVNVRLSNLCKYIINVEEYHLM